MEYLHLLWLHTQVVGNRRLVQALRRDIQYFECELSLVRLEYDAVFSLPFERNVLFCSQ